MLEIFRTAHFPKTIQTVWR